MRVATRQRLYLSLCNGGDRPMTIQLYKERTREKKALKKFIIIIAFRMRSGGGLVGKERARKRERKSRPMSDTSGP